MSEPDERLTDESIAAIKNHLLAIAKQDFRLSQIGALALIEEYEKRICGLEAKIDEYQENAVRLHKHRDAWRGYAYGNREKPSDFLDGNMVNRPETALERTERELAAANERLDKVVSLEAAQERLTKLIEKENAIAAIK